MRVLQKIDRGFYVVSKATNFIGAVWILIIMLVICTDVIGRVAVHMPLLGTTELVQNSLPAIVFLMLPWCTCQESHVRSGMLAGHLPGKIRECLLIFAYAVGALLFVGILYSTWGPMLWSTAIREFQGEGLRVPVYPVYWVIEFCAAISCYHCAKQIVRRVIRLVEIQGSENRKGVAK